MGNSNISRYSNYYLNMNTRKVFIDEKKFSSLLSKLENFQDKKSSALLHDILVEEFEDYISIKDKPKSEVQGRRRIEIGPLLGDKHGLLVSYGCGLTEYKNQYVINLLERLDIVIAITFNLPLVEVQEKLQAIADKYNISTKYLSVLTLSPNCPKNFIDSNTITVEDFCIFPEIKTYFFNLIKDEMTNNSHILTNIEGVDFLNYLDVEAESYLCMPLAFMFKLLMGASTIMRTIVVDYYGLGVKGIILSQDFCSITISTNDILLPFEYFSNVEKIKLPLSLL